MLLSDIDSVNIHDLEIYVDILKQKDIVHEHAWLDAAMSYTLGKWLPEEVVTQISHLLGSRTEFSMPTFPLNTDGIDPSGSNVTIRNVNITNFDDAVAVKPGKKNYKVAKDGCA
mmetsp:Transcript_11044/g.16777  ORF Transcript_11044/g.16777 Transcript_11044/m.16777 type:complete len:114 (-) Transcript_11044:721-1062(-)